MSPSMTEKIEVSKYSELARLVDEAHAAREHCVRLRDEMIEELGRFRGMLRQEVKERKRKIDFRDVTMSFGLGLIAVGIAVATHWAYSMIAIGVILAGLSLFPLMFKQKLVK